MSPFSISSGFCLALDSQQHMQKSALACIILTYPWQLFQLKKIPWTMYFVSKLNLRFLVSAWLYVFPLLLYFFLVTNTEIMSLHRESFFFQMACWKRTRCLSDWDKVWRHFWQVWLEKWPWPLMHSGSERSKPFTRNSKATNSKNSLT